MLLPPPFPSRPLLFRLLPEGVDTIYHVYYFATIMCRVSMLLPFTPSPIKSCPHGLTFTWWGCYSLCQRHKPTELAHSFSFCSFVCFCLYGPFNCISFHKFSIQLSALSLSSSGLNSALLVLLSTHLFMKVSLSSDIILFG